MDIPQTGIAFLAGILSFASPCVLSVAPGYLGMIGGELGEDGRRWRAFSATLFFTLGFSIVFILLGTAFSIVGQFLRAYRELFTRILGGIVVLFALHQLGVFKIAWLYREKRLGIAKLKSGPLKPFLIGIAFAFGWTPCVGPILGMILAMAGSTGKVSVGLGLLAVYSLGLAIPFIGFSLAFTAFRKLSRWMLGHAPMIEVTTGALLLAMGFLLLFNQLSQIGFWFNQFWGGWSPENWLQKKIQ